MGLVKEGEQFSILTDILGNEDHLGDMDFKVAGSENGITGFQMDIKIQGISYEIMEKALTQAKTGRMHILKIMNDAINQPRTEISKHAPSLLFTKINPDKIGMVIGSGGKTIQNIQKEYGVEVYIEEDGRVSIAGNNVEKAKLAKEFIRNLVAEPEIGKTYNGKVVKIAEFGAFVEFMPGSQGLLHISQIDTKRVKEVKDVLKVGDMIKVKLIKIENGKMSLSRKATMVESETQQNAETETTETN